jgi:hypothetical protein
MRNCSKNFFRQEGFFYDSGKLERRRFLTSIAIFLWRMFPQTIKQPGRDPLRHRATD